jgi:hypothetical protein
LDANGSKREVIADFPLPIVDLNAPPRLELKLAKTLVLDRTDIV